MGLPELLDALEREVDRQAREIQAGAKSEAERLLRERHSEVSEAHREGLQRERARLDDEATRARSRLRIERERKILATKRELLTLLREDVEERANAVDPGVLLPRLVDEVIADAGEGTLRLRVSASSVEFLRRDLAARHADVARRADIEAVQGLSPGVQLVLEAEVLDNTLASRLRKLWPNVEGKVATLLFGEDRDRV